MSVKNRKSYISKEKVKDILDIAIIAQAFSAKYDERPKQPLILCPFHNDQNLGSCRIYTDNNTFYCESCQTYGDTLKLASGYLDIPLREMDRLLEEIVVRFGIDRNSVTADPSPDAARRSQLKKLLPTKEEYVWLLGSDHYKIPIKFEEIELEKDEYEYWPTRYETVYFRTLALKDPEFHDWVVCTISRNQWLKDTEYVLQCDKEGRGEDCWFTRALVESRSEMLPDMLMNKKSYEAEEKLRTSLLRQMLIEEQVTAEVREILKGA